MNSIKKYFFSGMMMGGLLMMISTAFADGDPSAIIPSDQFLGFLFQSMGGLGSLKGLALVALIVQVVMKLLQTDFVNNFLKKELKDADGKLSGKYRLVAVSLLSLFGGVIALRVQGLTWWASLVHSSTLTMAQVYFNQIWQQFAPAPAAVTPPSAPSA